MDANLVVTYDPTHAGKAREEIAELLKEHAPKFLDSEFEGVFLVHTKDDAKKIVKHMADLCVKEPYRFKFTYRWMPVEKWSSTNMEDMEKAVKEMDSRIKPDESWKMDIGKRGYEGDTMNLLMKLTEQIDRPKVDLKNPQKIVKIEIVGDHAGFALLSKDEYLNVTKLVSV